PSLQGIETVPWLLKAPTSEAEIQPRPQVTATRCHMNGHPYEATLVDGESKPVPTLQWIFEDDDPITNRSRPPPSAESRVCHGVPALLTHVHSRNAGVSRCRPGAEGPSIIRSQAPPGKVRIEDMPPFTHMYSTFCFSVSVPLRVPMWLRSPKQPLEEGKPGICQFATQAHQNPQVVWYRKPDASSQRALVVTTSRCADSRVRGLQERDPAHQNSVEVYDGPLVTLREQPPAGSIEAQPGSKCLGGLQKLKFTPPPGAAVHGI
ncbi:Inactive tyrosine-protein kinase 7, partial [Camelus dromedarius]